MNNPVIMNTQRAQGAASAPITLIASALIAILLALGFGIAPVWADDGTYDEDEDASTSTEIIKDSGTYEGVPYKLSSQEEYGYLELTIGEDGSEYNVNCSELIKSIPNISELKQTEINKVTFAGTVHTSSCAHLLDGFTRLWQTDLSGLETSGATDMSYMFYRCLELNHIDVSNLDTSNVTDMGYMFKDCYVYELDLSGFDTSKVTNMELMLNCPSLTSLNITGFNTSAVTNMRAMFQNCDELTSLDVSGFNTSNVTNMRYMFNGCKALRTLDVSGFDTSNVTEMQRMFQGCNNLASLDLSGFDTSRVTDMSQMFQNCNSLTSLDVSGFDTSAVDTSDSKAGFYHMFSGCTVLQAIALGKNSLFAVNTPSNDWTRRQLPDGTPADSPTISNLSDYKGKKPGWYLVKNAAVEDKSHWIACGTGFTDSFAPPSSYFNKALIYPTDPAGTEYTWEKISGEGELSGGTRTDPASLTFYAQKTGDITIRLKAVSGGTELRTITRTYRIVEPQETYRLKTDSYFDETVPGTNFDVELLSWKDDGFCFATESVPEPAKAGFTWSQSGTGEVREIEPSMDGMVWTFEAVSSGRVDLTFTSTDGSWSKTEIIWINDPDVRPTFEIEVPDSYTYSPGSIWFELYKSGGSAYKPKVKKSNKYYLGKELSAVSSDESIAIPGTAYWRRPSEWSDETECKLPLKFLKPGKVTIWIIDNKSGKPLDEVTMNVTQRAVDFFNEGWNTSASAWTIQYGDPSLDVYCDDEMEGDAITLNINGEEQTATLRNGNDLSFPVSLMKPGTTGTITYCRSYDGYTRTKAVTVKDNLVRLLVSRVKPSSKKVTIKVTDKEFANDAFVVPGDYFKIKVGGKTYTKKVGSKPKYKFTQKIKKQKKGTKITVTLYNKYKQKRTTKTIKVK